jgi:hypothetical protein
LEKWLRLFRETIGERSVYGGPDASAGIDVRLCLRSVKDRRTVRFMVTELDVEKVIFPEGVFELGGSPVQDFEELVVWEKVPVASDDGESDAFALQVCKALRRGEAHGCPDGQDFAQWHPEGNREAFMLNDVPVSPDYGVEGAWEVRICDRLWFVPIWE